MSQVKITVFDDGNDVFMYNDFIDNIDDDYYSEDGDDDVVAQPGERAGRVEPARAARHP